MLVSLIVAMDRKGLIGTDTGLPWHLPADLKRFRQLTMGKPMIMGRTTHEHIGRPLDGRANIVLTRDQSYESEGCIICHSFAEALDVAEKIAAEKGGSKGGIPLADASGGSKGGIPLAEASGGSKGEIPLADHVVDEVMVIGGSKVYEEAFSRCDRIYLTVVEGEHQGSTFFAAELLKKPGWEVKEKIFCEESPKNPHAHHFIELQRSAGNGMSLADLIQQSI